MTGCRIVRKPNLVNICFFAALLALTAAVVPWYASRHGFARADWTLFWGLVVATGLSITVGYHRLFSHRAFRTHPLITFLSLFFGAAAFEESAYKWASLHRDHHRYVDTERDPYNIRQGFWYAHIGWMTLWTHEPDYSNVPDLAANPLVMHQHRHYLWWALGAGVALPLALGALTGHLAGALWLGVVARLTVVHHSTFSINSVCHTFGRATYDIDATARDHWLVALLTNGEGYHNFHHRFASDYRNGVRWYQWDPSKWVILLLSGVGLADRLYRVPAPLILAARTKAEHERIERALEQHPAADVPAILQLVRARYAALRHALLQWEEGEKAYTRLRQTAAAAGPAALRAVRQQAAEQRRTFLTLRRQWVAFVNSHPLIPQVARI